MPEGHVTETMQLPKAHHEALFMPASVNSDSRTIELMFYSGAAVQRYDWRSGKNYMLKLKMDGGACDLTRFSKGANVLNSHSTYTIESILGVVEKAWIKDGKGYASVRFSSRPDVEPFWQDVKSGIIQNVSMGVVVHSYEIAVGEDGSEVRTATSWEPVEVSLVAVPADPDASTRLAQSQPLFPCRMHRVQPTDQPPQQEELMSDPNNKENQPGAEALANTAAKPAAQPAQAGQQPAAQAENLVDAGAIERLRCQEILKGCRAVGLEQSVADDLIGKGVSLEAARGRILDLAAEKSKVTEVRGNSAPEALAKVDPSLPVEQRCKAEWDADEKLRAEFVTIEAFTAFKKADEAGQVRILNRTKSA